MKTKSYTVFIVDDDPVYLELLEKSLAKDKRLTIKKFPLGEMSISNLSQDPDIIVLDYFMDGFVKEAGNGLEILKDIKSKSPNTYVIMLSGQDEIAVAVDCIKSGAYEYIAKSPTAMVRLRHSVDKVISLSELKVSNKINKRGLILTTILLGIVTVSIAYQYIVPIVTILSILYISSKIENNS